MVDSLRQCFHFLTRSIGYPVFNTHSQGLLAKSLSVAIVKDGKVGGNLLKV